MSLVVNQYHHLLLQISTSISKVSRRGRAYLWAIAEISSLETFSLIRGINGFLLDIYGTSSLTAGERNGPFAGTPQTNSKAELHHGLPPSSLS
jgi:hypothetical protein